MKRRYGYGGLNERRTRIKGDWCVYCGELATTEDHFPPASITAKGWLLPCCSECNSVLRDQEPFDLLKRRHIVAKRYGRKLGRMKAEWRNTEIEEELEGNLRRSVKSYQTSRRRMVMRVKWSVEAYLARIAGDEYRFILGQAETTTMEQAA